MGGRAGSLVMGHRLFMLDVPENAPIAAVARRLPSVAVGRLGPYFVIETEAALVIDRRATGARHAVWYSCIAGLDGSHIKRWDKDVLHTEAR
jgi:hypothetical protein